MASEDPYRIVIVANRVPHIPTASLRSVGGLVSAVQPVLQQHGGLWFGWSGDVRDAVGEPMHRVDGNVTYVTCDLTGQEMSGYYEGFANRTLWPLLHGLPAYASIIAGDYETWRGVNARFAETLAPLLRSGDLVWVHDYQLIPLGHHLRQAGWPGRVGYFHHIPIPAVADWLRIPSVDTIAADFDAYDLIGVQTDRDRGRLGSYVGVSTTDRVRAFPIGIDVQRIRDLANAHTTDPFGAERRGRKVFLGLDRLDYTKGVPQRLEAYERFLAEHPEAAETSMFAQWSSPSREGIPEYQAERAAVEAIATRIDSDHPEAQPVQLRIETSPPEVVAAALRNADVCLVTSLADGMNLVAKEFVAVQRPEDPGVLILTDGCGAAEQLVESLIVPSGDVGALAIAMARALGLSLKERLERWQRLVGRVEAEDASSWGRDFIAALRET